MEAQFYQLLRDIEFDLRYFDYCKGLSRPLPVPERLPHAEVVACVQRLPIAFDYQKADKYFRYREKMRDWTLLFHLSITASTMEPMVYLRSGDIVLGKKCSNLVPLLVAGRGDVEVPEPLDVVLWYSTRDELVRRLEFATSLLAEVRAAVGRTGPWGSES